METKKEYIAPELTVVTVKMERGYAASNLYTVNILSNLLGTLTGSNMEVWSAEENQAFTETNGFTWD